MHIPPCLQLATQSLISVAADSLFPLLLCLPFLLVVFASEKKAVSSGGNIITNGSNTTPFRLLSIVSGIAACILCGLYEAVVREVGFRSMAKFDNVQLFRITKSPISLFFHTSRSDCVLTACSLSNIKQCHNQPELNSVRNRRYITHKCRKCIEIDSHVRQGCATFELCHHKGLMAVPCHILLRFKSYSNGVKSHYVVVLFACTQ